MRAPNKELTVTLVFTGRTRRSLDDLIDGALNGLPKAFGLATWAKRVRITKWEARDLTLHPRVPPRWNAPKKKRRTA